MACKCGNNEFECTQTQVWAVTVNDSEENIEYSSPNAEESEIEGPFTCTECGEEYDELPQYDENNDDE